MKLPRALLSLRRADAGRRGAALMVAFLVLIVLILIDYQLKTSTSTQARVTRNEQALRMMDESIESVLLQVSEDLKADGQAGAAGGADAAGGLGGLGGLGSGGSSGGASSFGSALEGASGGDASAGGDAGAGGAAGDQGPTDSKEDDWAHPQRTELNEIRLRILIQDENSKFDALSILASNEEEAQKAFDRLVRVIENCRKGTSAEIQPGEARTIATGILEFMNHRMDHELPKPTLLSDDPENSDIGLPLTLRELVGLDPDVFPPDLFRDFRDDRGRVVHSLGSFLTVWGSLITRGDLDARRAQPGQQGSSDSSGSSPSSSSARGSGSSASGASAQGDPGDQQGGDSGDSSGSGGQPSASGVANAERHTLDTININTASPAVLASLLDDRDVPRSFWDDVIEFRNTEDKDVPENQDPQLDEYGDPIIVNKYFHSIDDLTQIDGWEQIEPVHQNELRAMLGVQSDVFSIFVTARKPPQTASAELEVADRAALEREETEGTGLVRTVRCVVWRRVDGSGNVEIVPIVRWEVLDYVPYEIQDYPDEDR